MALAGVSTLGVLFGYATGSEKPSKFNLLTRINSIGNIDLTTNQIDASALEDYIDRFVAGRMSTGGTFSVTVNVTDDTIAEWEALIDEYEALSGSNEMWFETWSPYLTKGFFVKAQPPLALPQPSMDQNGLMTMEITLTITEYIGLDTAIKPTAE